MVVIPRFMIPLGIHVLYYPPTRMGPMWLWFNSINRHNGVCRWNDEIVQSLRFHRDTVLASLTKTKQPLGGHDNATSAASRYATINSRPISSKKSIFGTRTEEPITAYSGELKEILLVKWSYFVSVWVQLLSSAWLLQISRTEYIVLSLSIY